MWRSVYGNKTADGENMIGMWYMERMDGWMDGVMRSGVSITDVVPSRVHYLRIVCDDFVGMQIEQGAKIRSRSASL